MGSVVSLDSMEKVNFLSIVDVHTSEHQSVLDGRYNRRAPLSALNPSWWVDLWDSGLWEGINR